MSGAQTRRAAAELLMLTLDSRRTLDEAMAKTDSYNDLEGPDRGFARVMASAVLRELGRIDAGGDEEIEDARARLLRRDEHLVRVVARRHDKPVAVHDDPVHQVLVDQRHDGGEVRLFRVVARREQREKDGDNGHEDDDVYESVTGPLFAHSSCPTVTPHVWQRDID